jgi:hypothetical protein
MCRPGGGLGVRDGEGPDLFVVVLKLEPPIALKAVTVAKVRKRKSNFPKQISSS